MRHLWYLQRWANLTNRLSAVLARTNVRWSFSLPLSLSLSLSFLFPFLITRSYRDYAARIDKRITRHKLNTRAQISLFPRSSDNHRYAVMWHRRSCARSIFNIFLQNLIRNFTSATMIVYVSRIDMTVNCASIRQKVEKGSIGEGSLCYGKVPCLDGSLWPVWTICFDLPGD